VLVHRPRPLQQARRTKDPVRQRPFVPLAVPTEDECVQVHGTAGPAERWGPSAVTCGEASRAARGGWRRGGEVLHAAAAAEVACAVRKPEGTEARPEA